MLVTIMAVATQAATADATMLSTPGDSLANGFAIDPIDGLCTGG